MAWQALSKINSNTEPFGESLFAENTGLTTKAATWDVPINWRVAHSSLVTVSLHSAAVTLSKRQNLIRLGFNCKPSSGGYSTYYTDYCHAVGFFGGLFLSVTVLTVGGAVLQPPWRLPGSLSVRYEDNGINRTISRTVDLYMDAKDVDAFYEDAKAAEISDNAYPPKSNQAVLVAHTVHDGVPCPPPTD